MRSICAILAVFIYVSAGYAQTVVPEKWQSQHYADNPLVGQIFNSKGQRIVNHDRWMQLLSAVNFVLLGEVHDNPDHHLIQAKFIRELVRVGGKPSIVFEMVPHPYADEISNYDLSTDPKLDDFASRLDWENRGWYSWDIYRPVALAAADNRLKMVAGNLGRKLTRKISKQGVDVFSKNEQAELGLDATFDDASLIEELAGSHCGLMPKTALPAMATVQRARDGSMARALSQLKGRGILIAGNGHVRKDRGVPSVLQHILPGHTKTTIGQYKAGGSTERVEIKVRMPNAANIAIGILEVREGATNFTNYEILNVNNEPLFDYVIFTPKFDITDHCAAMREQFKKKKKSP